jgi:hypothetical protein
MPNANELIAKAQTQIGVKESPADSNIVKYWDWYKQHTGVNLQGNPWCAAFVTWCMGEIGAWNVTSDEGRFRYCPSLVNWAKANGQWVDREDICQAGDIILFANKGEACHVGIVEARISSSQVQTIEGNTSASSNDNGGAVMRRTRNYGTVGSKWYILGFVRTPWNTLEEDDMPTAKEVAEAVWTAEINGHTASERLYLCNVMDYDKSDPTGRGKEYTNHDHIKWIAAVVSDLKDSIATLSTKLEALESKLEELELVESKDETEDTSTTDI